MKPTVIIAILTLALGAVFAPLAGAQDVLPFPPTPSVSIAGRDIQESFYKQRIEPRRLPAAAPFRFNGKIEQVSVKYTK